MMDRYDLQQTCLNAIAGKLGVVCYRPEYHAKSHDANTVLFYLTDDARHNREVDKQAVQYSSTFARLYHITDERYIYKDPFFVFQNTDVNGNFSFDFANNGKIDLRSCEWKERLEGALRLALIRKIGTSYIASVGGVLGLKEADDTANDLNRETIAAFKMRYGKCFMGNINIMDDAQRKKIVEAKAGIFTEFTGQLVHNFECAFIVPVQDRELEDMIVCWNDSTVSGKDDLLKKIQDRIAAVGGEALIWR